MVREYDIVDGVIVHLPTKLKFEDLTDVVRLLNGQVNTINKLKNENRMLKKKKS